MSCGKHNCDWTTCTLCRSGRQSLSTLQRASRRSVDWSVSPKQPPHEQIPTSYVSIDDAFDSVLQYMSTTTRQCKRFHRSSLKQHTSDSDLLHIQRFHHHSQHQQHFYKNPLQKPDGVQVEVAPGTYTVSAGSWGSDRQHTHVVHVREGQTVDLTFNMQ